MSTSRIMLLPLIACLLISVSSGTRSTLHGLQMQPDLLHHAQSNGLDHDELTECVNFLKRHIPAIDSTGSSSSVVTEAYLRRNAQLALQARQQQPWAGQVPWDIFLNDVLPYANVDEPRDNWRELFYNLFSPLVAASTSISEAAQTLNREIWQIWGIHFKSDQTPEIMSPTQVIAAGYASCTGLSIFLVNACRAVGIPARVAGTPSWVQSHKTEAERFNNHNWVEIWDGVWSFTGAAEYNPAGFNRTWFFPLPAKNQIPNDVMHAIYAVSYKQMSDGRYFPLAWNEEYQGVNAVDVTQNYLEAAAMADPLQAS